jgi:hypothetical protein
MTGAHLRELMERMGYASSKAALATPSSRSGRQPRSGRGGRG